MFYSILLFLKTAFAPSDEITTNADWGHPYAGLRFRFTGLPSLSEALKHLLSYWFTQESKTGISEMIPESQTMTKNVHQLLPMQQCTTIILHIAQIFTLCCEAFSISHIVTITDQDHKFLIKNKLTE